MVSTGGAGGGTAVGEAGGGTGAGPGGGIGPGEEEGQEVTVTVEDWVGGGAGVPVTGGAWIWPSAI